MQITNTSTTMPTIVTVPPSKLSDLKSLNANGAFILKMATYLRNSNADAIGLLAAGDRHPPRRRPLRTFHGSAPLYLSISLEMVLDGNEQ